MSPINLLLIITMIEEEANTVDSPKRPPPGMAQGGAVSGRGAVWESRYKVLGSQDHEDL